MTRTEDERCLWAVLMSKQPPVPILADMLEKARAEALEQGWDEGFHKAGRLLTGLDSEPWPPSPNPYRQDKQ